MGQNRSKVAKSRVITFMQKKYGDSILQFLPTWSKNEFPLCGSLNLNQLRKLKEKIDRERDRHDKILQVWFNESIAHERIKNCKQMTRSESQTLFSMEELSESYEYIKHKQSPRALFKDQNTAVSSSCISPGPTVGEAGHARTAPDDSYFPVPCPTTQQQQQTAEEETQEVMYAKADQCTGAAILSKAEKMMHRHRAERAATRATVNTQNCTADTAVMLPMIPVVQRQWTAEDIKELSKELPNVRKNAAKFGKALKNFCRAYRPTGFEIQRILSRSLRAGEMTEISKDLPDFDLTADDPVYEHNSAYIIAVDTLTKTLKKMFKQTLNMDRVHACKQKQGESMEHYLDRFEAVFRANFGLDENHACFQDALCVYARQNMLPEFQLQIKKTLIGDSSDGHTLRQLRIHAFHAEEILKEERTFEENRGRISNMSFTMMQDSRNSGSGQRNGQHSANIRCHFCHKIGHRWRWCRELPPPPPHRRPQRHFEVNEMN